MHRLHVSHSICQHIIPVCWSRPSERKNSSRTTISPMACRSSQSQLSILLRRLLLLLVHLLATRSDVTAFGVRRAVQGASAAAVAAILSLVDEFRLHGDLDHVTLVTWPPAIQSHQSIIQRLGYRRVGIRQRNYSFSLQFAASDVTAYRSFAANTNCYYCCRNYWDWFFDSRADDADIFLRYETAKQNASYCYRTLSDTLTYRSSKANIINKLNLTARNPFWHLLKYTTSAIFGDKKIIVKQKDGNYNTLLLFLSELTAAVDGLCACVVCLSRNGPLK